MPPTAIEGFDFYFFLNLKAGQRLAMFVDRLLMNARRGSGADELVAKSLDLLLQRGLALGQGFVLGALALKLLLDVFELRVGGRFGGWRWRIGVDGERKREQGYENDAQQYASVWQMTQRRGIKLPQDCAPAHALLRV